MSKESFIDCERKSADKLKKIQLPNQFIKIGLVIVIFSFLSFLLLKKRRLQIDLQTCHTTRDAHDFHF